MGSQELGELIDEAASAITCDYPGCGERAWFVLEVAPCWCRNLACSFHANETVGLVADLRWRGIFPFHQRGDVRHHIDEIHRARI